MILCGINQIADLSATEQKRASGREDSVRGGNDEYISRHNAEIPSKSAILHG